MPIEAERGREEADRGSDSQRYADRCRERQREAYSGRERQIEAERGMYVCIHFILLCVG